MNHFLWLHESTWLDPNITAEVYKEHDIYNELCQAITVTVAYLFKSDIGRSHALYILAQCTRHSNTSTQPVEHNLLFGLDVLYSEQKDWVKHETRQYPLQKKNMYKRYTKTNSL